MRLIADCGNSTVKLAIMHKSGVWLHERLPIDPARWDTFIEPHRETIEEFVILPTGQSVTALRAWWPTAATLRVVGEHIPLPDVGQYPSFGMDRLCAGLAATAQERMDCIVVDAGTATTITAWQAHGLNGVNGLKDGHGLKSGPKVVGGLILPGAEACAAGLAAAAPALPAYQPQWKPATAAVMDTDSALSAALGIGYPAMVAACIARLTVDTGISCVVSTGGASVPMLGGVLGRRSYRPSLVCEGVEILARG